MSDGDIRFKWQRVPGEDESSYGLFMYYRESAMYRIPVTWEGEVSRAGRGITTTGFYRAPGHLIDRR